MRKQCTLKRELVVMGHLMIKHVMIRALVAAVAICCGCVSGWSVTLDDRLGAIIGDRQVGVAVYSPRGEIIVAGDTAGYRMADMSRFFQAVEVAGSHDFDELVNSRVRIERDSLRRDVWSPLRAAMDSASCEIPPVALIDYSLMMNDNNAARILTDRFLNGTPRVSDHTEMTPHAAVSRMHDFFVADTVASDILVKAVMARESAFGRERIVAGIPSQSARVFHKTGTSPADSEGVRAVVSDLAMVSYPVANGYGHYAIGVFVRNHKGDLAEADKLIADISGAVWSDIIVDESLSVGLDSVWRAPKSSQGPAQNDDEKYTWGDFLIDTVFTIVDHAIWD